MGVPTKVTRTIIPVVLTLLVLGIFLLLYLLKYLPQQQSAYNNRAFLELDEIARAIQSRNNGYAKAISFYSNKPSSSSPIAQSLRFSPHPPDDTSRLQLSAMNITQDL